MYATVPQTAGDYITKSIRPSLFFSLTFKNMERPGFEVYSACNHYLTFETFFFVFYTERVTHLSFTQDRSHFLKVNLEGVFREGRVTNHIKAFMFNLDQGTAY